MSERHTSTSWTGISHSAGPAFGVEHSIRSEIPAISPFVDRLNIVIKRCRCVPGSETEVEVSLREALANGIVHGNREDPNKHVHVGCRCVSDEEVSIVDRDEGKGFNSAEFPDPTALEQLEPTHGRGIYLMTTLMDEVHFERGGTVVRMRKKSAQAGHSGRRLS